MIETDIFLAALRRQETGSEEPDYMRRGPWVEAMQTRLVGAYNIPATQWSELAASAGYPNAIWFDKKAQDAVVKTHVERLFAKYKNWQLVATAWKAGERFADAAYQNPTIIQQEKTGELKRFVDGVTANARLHPGIPSSTAESAMLINPFRDKAEESSSQVTSGSVTPKSMMTGIIRALRDVQNTQKAEEVSNGDLAAGSEGVGSQDPTEMAQ